jgi:hypothetical protein
LWRDAWNYAYGRIESINTARVSTISSVTPVPKYCPRPKNPGAAKLQEFLLGLGYSCDEVGMILRNYYRRVDGLSVLIEAVERKGYSRKEARRMVLCLLAEL